MHVKTYERFTDHEVTDEMLDEAAQLFSQNYGVWSKYAEEAMGKFAKAGRCSDSEIQMLYILIGDSGSHVRLGKERLRKEYLPEGISSYARVSVDGKLAGNAFVCRWTVADKTVCWITQLVVHRDYRERGLATGLLNSIMLEEDGLYGIMSSQPAACLAAANAFQSKLPADWRFIQLA
jgi:GNAT superfamily N-acetyltransferase